MIRRVLGFKNEYHLDNGQKVHLRDGHLISTQVQFKHPHWIVLPFIKALAN